MMTTVCFGVFSVIGCSVCDRNEEGWE